MISRKCNLRKLSITDMRVTATQLFFLKGFFWTHMLAELKIDECFWDE